MILPSKAITDPKPYQVIDRKGSVVTAKRGDKTLDRDASSFRKFKARLKEHYHTNGSRDDEDSDEYDSFLQYLRKRRREE